MPQNHSKIPKTSQKHPPNVTLNTTNLYKTLPSSHLTFVKQRVSNFPKFTSPQKQLLYSEIKPKTITKNDSIKRKCMKGEGRKNKLNQKLKRPENTCFPETANLLSLIGPNCFGFFGICWNW
jgi:hypothetical protein